jgi:hypothetical protein
MRNTKGFHPIVMLLNLYRPASAGKPRIPPDAEITFDVEMVGIPGKEPELIELIGDV